MHPNYSKEEQLIALLETLKGAKQTEILLYYFQLQASEKTPISVKRITEDGRFSSATIKSLVDKNIFEE